MRVAVYIVLLLSAVTTVAVSQSVNRFGPADDPEIYPDYGGTPDLTISGDLGLSEKEIEDLLSQLASTDLQTRINAAAQLKADAPGSEQNIKEVLWRDHGARNPQMREAMGIARRRLADSGDDSGGLLGALVSMDPSHPSTGQGVKACTRVTAMLSALMSLDTMAGYKVVLDFSGRHAGVFRRHIGNLLVSGGMKTLPALIYGRGSKNDELHMFAVKWIRDMGNPLLGEQIRDIENPRRLAQLLEAYASVNELDAIDVTLSLANHDSVFVRRAARRCLEIYGKNAKWSVRRAYENTFGEEPVEGTEEPHWLAKLFDHWDRERIASALALMEEGLAAAKSGNLKRMEDSYRSILRESPMFPRRHEMAPGLLKLARDLGDREKIERALEVGRLAFRVAKTGSKEAEQAKAGLDWLRAEKMRKAGVFDETLYSSVAENDPENDEAVDWSERYEVDASGRRGLIKKGIIVSGIVFLGATLVLLRLRRKREDT